MNMLRGRFGDRYKIIDSIGAGGVGHVYSALDRELKKKLALKVLSDGFGARVDIQANFLKASEAGRKISHPNIMHILDLGRADGLAFCAMELLEGENLKTILQKKGMLDWSEAKPMFLQLCDALSALHSNSITHRNLKPSKVFLSHSGAMTLLDFTLAKVPGSDFPKDCVFVGTPWYVAPEQVLRNDSGHRVDIYVLGLMIYETLTSILPFKSENMAESLLGRIHEGVYPAMELNKRISRRLNSAIMKALSSDPKDRYQSADEMKKAIESV